MRALEGMRPPIRKLERSRWMLMSCSGRTQQRATMQDDMRDSIHHPPGFRFGERRFFGARDQPRDGLGARGVPGRGLLWLDPGGLRHLIFTDRSPGVALGLLLFGFIVTLAQPRSAARSWRWGGSGMMSGRGRKAADIVADFSVNLEITE